MPEAQAANFLTSVVSQGRLVPRTSCPWTRRVSTCNPSPPGRWWQAPVTWRADNVQWITAHCPRPVPAAPRGLGIQHLWPSCVGRLPSATAGSDDRGLSLLLPGKVKNIADLFG